MLPFRNGFVPGEQHPGDSCLGHESVSNMPTMNSQSNSTVNSIEKSMKSGDYIYSSIISQYKHI